ncbi:sterol desaturase family protein [Salinibius halmophilus]|uniref:sterol desaturase family protein n=1 Tax=Salinibius halmophilus TaxID=1853216 RepID=UPI000E66E958|nr:sterol desaturase family protein [Salinibius halmophilus]
MQEFESIIRLSVFFGLLLVLMAAEALWPRKQRRLARGQRWLNNLLLTFGNTLVLRLLVPVTGVAAAAFAASNGIGVFNWLAVPAWLAVVASVLLLDMLIYWQHVAFHKVPVLWRLHRVHHSDTDIDVTTGSRFHTIEIILSMLIKLVAIMVLGVPVVAVILFEVILNGMAMFNHANLRLPHSVDRLLRQVLVTPDFHRVHHSVHRDECNSNYGFNLSLWDRLFNSYVAQPRDGHDDMQIGQKQFRDQRSIGLHWLLIQPWLK